MNATLISKEKTAVKLSFEVSAEVLEQGMAFAYNKHKNNLSLPGFRKGKVPRKLIEAQYGEGFFYEDAINHIFPDEYMAAVKELGLDVVSAPTLDIDYIQSGKGAKFICDVTVKPEVELGQYKGLEVEKVSAEVTDEDVMKELEKVQKQNARKVEEIEFTATDASTPMRALLPHVSTLTSSAQTSYPSLRRKRQSSYIPLRLLCRQSGALSVGGTGERFSFFLLCRQSGALLAFLAQTGDIACSLLTGIKGRGGIFLLHFSSDRSGRALPVILALWSPDFPHDAAVGLHPATVRPGRACIVPDSRPNVKQVAIFF